MLALRCWLWGLFGCLLVFPGSLHAQSAGVMPPVLDDGIDEDVARTVVRSVERALGEERIEVVPARDLFHLARANRCDEDPRTCALYTRTDLDVDYVVLITVRREGSTAEPTHVGVRLLHEHDEQYTATAQVERPEADAATPVERPAPRAPHAAVAEAALVALDEARRKQARGPGPWLILQGHPAGARVELNGKLAGGIPLQVQVPGGLHRIRFEAEGYASHAEEVEVPRAVDAEAVVEVRLDRVTDEGAEDAAPDQLPSVEDAPQALGAADPDAAAIPDSPSDAAPTRNSMLNNIIGGGLVVGGLVLIASPLRNALRSGDCLAPLDGAGRCGERVHFGPRSRWLTAAAVATGVTGAAFLLWQPIQVQVAPHPGGATAHLRLEL